MSIRLVSKSKENLLYRVYCDECNAPSNCTDLDPGDLSIKAKKERFVTKLGNYSYDPMTWLCQMCQ